jgi:subtilisin family serine protease
MDVARFASRFFAMVLSAAVLTGCDLGAEKEAAVPYESVKSQCRGSAIENRYIVKWKDGDISALSFDSEDQMRKALSVVVDEIEVVENDQMLYQREVTESATATPSWGQTAIEVSNAWSQNVKGDGVIVSVVDSGVDRNHSQISPRLAINAGEIANNGVDDDGNGLVDDVSGYWFWHEIDYETGNVTDHDTADVIDTTGHGTHVAGVIAADHNAGSVLGVAPKAKILSVGFMSGKVGQKGGGSLSDAIRAIQYSVSQGAKVINASWGGRGCNTILKNLIGSLEAQGVAFANAAGNGDAAGKGYNLDYWDEFPAAFGLPGQTTVGSFGPAGVQSQYSNYSRNYVHLLAPGESILSTYPGNTTKSMTGTSMATPFVAGTIALLMSDRPQASVAQIKQALMSSVDTGNFEVASRGKLNVRKALAALRAIVP